MEFNVEIKEYRPKFCDAGYRELWIYVKLLMQGDAYHDKIRVAIENFLDGIKVAGNTLNIVENEIPCKFGC